MDFLSGMDLGAMVVIIGLLGVCAVAIFGWMIYYITSSQKKKSVQPPKDKQEPGLSQTVPFPSAGKRGVIVAAEPAPATHQRGQFASLSQVGRRASAAPTEVMKLLRDRVTGALVIEVDGTKYRALQEIQDAQVGRQVLRVAADLVCFTEVMKLQDRDKPRERSYPKTTSPPAPSHLALKVAPAMEQKTPVRRTPAPPSVEREFLESLTKQIELEQQEFEKPTLSPIDFFRRGFAARRRAGVQSNTPSPRSFVDEIEDILQRFVRTYPSFIGKKVHVGTGPEGKIQIQVESEFYDTPDDIPDPEIRGIIKAAIQEWEKS